MVPSYRMAKETINTGPDTWPLCHSIRAAAPHSSTSSAVRVLPRRARHKRSLSVACLWRFQCVASYTPEATNKEEAGFCSCYRNNNAPWRLICPACCGTVPDGPPAAPRTTPQHAPSSSRRGRGASGGGEPGGRRRQAPTGGGGARTQQLRVCTHIHRPTAKFRLSPKPDGLTTAFANNE